MYTHKQKRDRTKKIIFYFGRLVSFIGSSEVFI